jgi:hypothetical protein
VWGPKKRPETRYISTSFAEDAVKRDTRKMRDLIQSEWYQERWGGHVKLNRFGETSFSNTKTGGREGSPFGSLTSKRGDRLIIDDPHSTKTAESDVERAATTRQLREGASNRLNDQMRSAIVIIMQRLHSLDCSGVVLEEMPEYTHLCLPMEYEPDRRCKTKIGFVDWRHKRGEVLDPVRFPPPAIKELKAKGSYFWACQYEQRRCPARAACSSASGSRTRSSPRRRRAASGGGTGTWRRPSARSRISAAPGPPAC